MTTEDYNFEEMGNLAMNVVMKPHKMIQTMMKYHLFTNSMMNYSKKGGIMILLESTFILIKPIKQSV